MTCIMTWIQNEKEILCQRFEMACKYLVDSKSLLIKVIIYQATFLTSHKGKVGKKKRLNGQRI